MATGKEYFIGEERFTPSQFRRLSRARKVEAMVQWFYSNYQDPVHETSYNGREGGYLWNHGGPYDADEELQDEFSDLADFEVIQDAVSEATSDGIYEWAPIRSDHDDYTDDDYDRDLRLREGEPDDGIYSINEPLPDISDLVEDEDEEEANRFPELPPSQAYPTDENDRILTDERGRGLIVDAPTPSGVIGGGSLNEYVINGPAYLGAAFAGSSFATGDSLPSQAAIEALRLEMLDRLDQLEVIIRQNQNVAPNRGHNHPPELLEIERPVTQEQFQQVVAAIEEVRQEGESPAPDVANVEAQISIFRRIAKVLAVTVLGAGFFVMTEIASLEIGLAHTQHRQAVIDALVKASDSALAWVQSLSPMF